MYEQRQALCEYTISMALFLRFFGYCVLLKKEIFLLDNINMECYYKNNLSFPLTNGSECVKMRGFV